MKRNYTALALALCLCLAGCGKRSEAPKDDKKPDKVAARTTKNEAYEPEKDKAAAEKALFESDNEDKRNAALEDASDYIALVELSTNANGQMELEFIKNYKGMLSTVELPVPKGMTPMVPNFSPSRKVFSPSIRARISSGFAGVVRS